MHVFIDPRKRTDCIRHWSELQVGFFFLVSGRSGKWILKVVSADPMIQVRKYSLNGYKFGFGSSENKTDIKTLSLGFLQDHGILPDPLHNFTILYCVLPLDTNDFHTAISRANEIIEQVKSEN